MLVGYRHRLLFMYFTLYYLNYITVNLSLKITQKLKNTTLIKLFKLIYLIIIQNLRFEIMFHDVEQEKETFLELELLQMSTDHQSVRV